MSTKHLATKNHNLTSFFFRYRAVKITILVIGHFLGAFVFTILTFLLAEYVIEGLSAVISTFFGAVWNSFTLDLLPPFILGLSFIVIIVSNPIYALVSLILIFFSTALFLIGLQVEFLALIYIIIYIGAIAILFLFVIMMFNLKELQDSTTWSQNKDFLFISFTFYLFLLLKLYYVLLGSIKNYVEYDTYFNGILTLKYKLVFKHTQNYYNNFLYDVSQGLLIETNNSGINKIYSNNFFNSLNNNLLDIIHKQYINKTENLSELNFETYLDEAKVIYHELSSPINTFLTSYKSPIDISIIGQVFYTYYSYLFLLATMILLIAMIGAIILALSTSEKKEVFHDLSKSNL